MVNGSPSHFSLPPTLLKRLLLIDADFTSNGKSVHHKLFNGLATVCADGNAGKTHKPPSRRNRRQTRW
jgi:hypothetical protein